MKKILILATAATLSLNGCANMSKEQQAALGALGGAALGGAVGGALGGGKGAAIGAGAGALLGGIAAYSLASDPFTQNANQQANTWQNEVGAKTELVSAPQVVENGQTVQRIDTQKMVVPSDKMVVGNHLSPKVRAQLVESKKATDSLGGNVQVVCPATASKAVLHEIQQTGVAYTQDQSLNQGYEVLVSRNKNGI